MKKLIVLKFILILLLFSCKKYPQDHKVSLHSAKKRLTDKKWLLKELLVDGSDQTNSSFHITSGTWGLGIGGNCIYTQTEFAFKWDGMGFSGSATQPLNIYSCLSVDGNSNWRFEDHKNEITIHAVLGNSYLFSQLKDDIWSIEKLTDSEFIIENENTNQQVYRVTFSH